MATAAAALVLQKYGTLPRNIPLSVVFPSSLPGQWEDFRRSGLPTSMGLVDRAARRLTPHPTPPSVLEAFASGNPMAEFVDPTSGRRCVLDFLRKILIAFPDANGSKVGVQAFYWVEEDGELFMSASLGGVNGASVVQSFLGPAQGRLAVTSLRRCRHRAALVFGFLDKMKYRDTWLFGWYGASSADVEEATNGGDVPDNWQLIGPEMAHGRGVHVSAVDYLQARYDRLRLCPPSLSCVVFLES